MCTRHCGVWACSRSRPNRWSRIVLALSPSQIASITESVCERREPAEPSGTSREGETNARMMGFTPTCSRANRRLATECTMSSRRKLIPTPRKARPCSTSPRSVAARSAQRTSGWARRTSGRRRHRLTITTGESERQYLCAAAIPTSFSTTASTKSASRPVPAKTSSYRRICLIGKKIRAQVSRQWS
jgi:hypothetical protein